MSDSMSVIEAMGRVRERQVFEKIFGRILETMRVLSDDKCLAIVALLSFNSFLVVSRSGCWRSAGR